MNITDAFNSVSPQRASEVAFGVIDTLQSLPPAEQVAGASMLFHVLLKKYDMDPREVLPSSARRMLDALTPNPNAKPGDITRALRDYIEKEI